MIYRLMSKNTPVAEMELADSTEEILKVRQGLNLEFLPMGGQQKKKWVIMEGKRCLIKSGSEPFYQEPVNEVLATSLHERLGFSWHLPYELLVEEGMPYCICENFLSSNTEFVDAKSICKSMGGDRDSFTYGQFIDVCEGLEISQVREFIDYMLVFDYLMANQRDFQKFGLIRNAKTLEWIGPAPLFDCSSGLWYNRETKDIMKIEETKGSIFDTDEVKQLETVSDLSWIRFERLKDWENDIKETFSRVKYIDEDRVETLIKAIKKRIEVLRELQEERRNMTYFYQVY